MMSLAVYGFATNDIVYASGCTRTKPVNFAQEDLQILGTGQLLKTST